MYADIEITFMAVMYVHNGLEIFILRGRSIVVEHHDIDIHTAQLVGNLFNHTSGLIYFVEIANCATNKFAMAA
jgi:hypothetical protein